MFDTLIESRQIPSRRPRHVLPFSLALHLGVVVSIALASYFLVEMVRDPDLPVVFGGFIASAAAPPPPPPPPAGGSEVVLDPEEAEVELELDPQDLVQPHETLEPVDDIVKDRSGEVGQDGGQDDGVVGGVRNGVPLGTLGGDPDRGVPGGVDIESEGSGLPIPGHRPDVIKPVLRLKVEPAYPEVARVARSEGSVICQAVISADGDVTDVTVLGGVTNPFLRAEAQRALREWKYEPAIQNGRRVSVYITVIVNFELR